MNPLNFCRTVALSLLLASSSLVAKAADNEFSIAAPQIQQHLEAAFPRQYEALGGLFTLTARDPQISIPPTGQRLQLAFSASASSSGGADTPVGRIHLSSGLRYDPASYALYLDQPTVDEVQPASAGHRVDEQTRLLLNLWLADYARKEPLYQLEPAMVATLGGLQVESARIDNGKVVVRFNQPVGASVLGKPLD